MGFKKGDIIKYLNQKGGGIVIEVLEGDFYCIEDETGFIFQVSGNEIVAPANTAVNVDSVKAKLADIGSSFDDQHDRSHSTGHDYHALMRNYLQSSRAYWTNRKKDFVEVDLHIEELTERPKSLSDGEKLNHQLNHAKECLHSAVDMKISTIVFIHGVGAGVLRHELRAWLKSLGYVSFENADHRRYGIGATEVRVHGHFDGTFS
ncbi:MAG: Smr/MutS family protein [Vicingaceae bacterium]